MDQTDYALLYVEELKGSTTYTLSNKYYKPDGQLEVPVQLSGFKVDKNLKEGPVYIMCGPYNLVDGKLGVRLTFLDIHGVVFKLRKIITEAPLDMINLISIFPMATIRDILTLSSRRYLRIVGGSGKYNI